MARRLWPTSKRWQRIAAASSAVVILAAAIIIMGWDRQPSLQSMGIRPHSIDLMAVVEGEQWQPPAAGGDGFVDVADNGSFALKIDPRTSQITVLDKKSGYLWRSNPSKEQLGKETVQGALLANLESPYILEYVSGSQPRRLVKNSIDSKIEISYTLMGDKGIQAGYTYPELHLSFVIQYVLTEHGLEARIPSEGIVESGDNKVFAINLLPFFGGVSKAEEPGYLFVPDGPGGLIYYDRKRPANINSYEFPIYGNDMASLKVSNDNRGRREEIGYPVFGLKRGEHAFAAIVKEGQFSASIKAALPGQVSSYHTASANFSYREEYGRRVSGVTDQLVITIQKERTQHDRSVEYRLLSGEAADYVGMAHSYRDYLEQNGMLGSPLPKTDNVPIQLSFLGGGTKPKFGGSDYEPATTFEQAEQIVEELMQQGVTNMRLSYQGWQNSGRYDTDERFPVVSEIGGNEGAKRFIQSMHEKGFTVYFEDYAAWRNSSASSFDIKSDGIRSIDSTVLQFKQGGIRPYTEFIVNPIKIVQAQKEVIDQLKELGVDGIHYIDGPGDELFSDHNEDAPLTRKETAYYYEALLDYTRKELGGAGVYKGFSYSLQHVDFVQSLPYDWSYDMIIDEMVPFYPIVVHGMIEYTAAPANERNVYDKELLRAIEYGAIPFFGLTYEENRVLKDTDYVFIFSSEYEIWKDRIIEEYGKFNQLASVYHQRIRDHEKLAEGVYATTYEDGTTVQVDYNRNQFEVTKGGAK
jgi:hypothetical protein